MLVQIDRCIHHIDSHDLTINERKKKLQYISIKTTKNHSFAIQHLNIKTLLSIKNFAAYEKGAK